MRNNKHLPRNFLLTLDGSSFLFGICQNFVVISFNQMLATILLFRYCDIDTQGNKALVMKQYLSNEKVVIILILMKQYDRHYSNPV
jgi:hypothetical protein